MVAGCPQRPPSVQPAHGRGPDVAEDVSIDVPGQLHAAVPDLARDVPNVLALVDEEAHVGVPERVQAGPREPEPGPLEEGHEVLPVPRIRIEPSARLPAEDEACLADRRVHGLVDHQVVEELLGHVDHAIRSLGLRRGHVALVDRPAHLEAPALTVARVDVLPCEREDLAAPEAAEEHTIITTAGDDEHSVGAEVHRYAERVRDGILTDPSFLPVIYAASEDADPWSEEVWFATNPALGDFRSLEEFRVAARQAREVPGREASFRKLYLNQWGTHAETRWLDMARWDACGAPVDSEALRGQPCIVGLDLSTTKDLSAMLVIFPPDADGTWDLLAHFWVPADYLELRARRDRVPYPQWVAEGWITATPGNTIDYSVIEDVVAIGVDPWNAKGLIVKLQAEGLPAVEVGQTMANLSGPSKELERLVLAGQLRHGAHPVLRWCMANAVVDTDANGNLKPSKKRSQERIDGVSALVTALALAHVEREEPPTPLITVLG